MITASVGIRRVSLRRRRDAPRRATGAIGACRRALDTRRDAVVIRRGAFGLRTAALGARRAAVRLCIDARGLRTASLRVPTDAPFNPTDALRIPSAPFVSTDGCSRSSQRCRRRSKGSSTQTSGCPTRNSGRSARTSGCSRYSQGCRTKIRSGFAKNHAVIASFSSFPSHLGGSRANARSTPRDTKRLFARTSGRRRCDSRRPTRRERCPRRSQEARSDTHGISGGSCWTGALSSRSPRLARAVSRLGVICEAGGGGVEFRAGGKGRGRGRGSSSMVARHGGWRPPA
jgi:hypothetical protein